MTVRVVRILYAQYIPCVCMDLATPSQMGTGHVAPLSFH